MTDKANATLQYVLGRLKEPSTWAGIAVFIGMFGLSQETLNRITTNGPAIITALATLIAIFAPGSKKAVVVTPDQLEGGTALLTTSGPEAVTIPAAVTLGNAEAAPHAELGGATVNAGSISAAAISSDTQLAALQARLATLESQLAAANGPRPGDSL